MPAAYASTALKIGGSLFGRKKKKRAKKRRAREQQEAARQAAIQTSFRPVGVTTRFGQSNFQVDKNGQLIGSAGYTLSPDIRRQQDRFGALSRRGLAQAEQAGQDFAPLGQAAQGLFSLGRGYLAQTPEQAAAKFMAQQQNLLAPSRERQFSQLQNSVFNTGRQGLAVGGTGMRPGGGAGLGSANPDLEAYYNALAQQDAELATRATQGGMDQTRFGAGLFDAGSGLIGQQYAGQVAALGPYEQYLAQMKGLEGLGQQSLEMGLNLGQLRRNAQGGNALLQGGLQAAESRYGSPSSVTADILSGLSNADTLRNLGSLFSRPSATSSGNYTPADYGFGGARLPNYDPGPTTSFNYGGYTSPSYSLGRY
jgi:hypothetical protein